MPLARFRRIMILIAISDVRLRVGNWPSKHRERIGANAGSGFERGDVRDARVLAQLPQHLGEASLTLFDNFDAHRPQALSLETLERCRDIPAWF